MNNDIEKYDPYDGFQNFAPAEIDADGDVECPFCEDYFRVDVDEYDYEQYDNDMIKMDLTCPLCGELFPAISRFTE